MGFLEIGFLGLGLSMDCFAVSVGLGTSKKLVYRDLLVMALFFGFFQGLMTFLGWLFGSFLKPVIESFDHWIAFSLLAIIGLRMIFEAFEKEKEKRSIDIRRLSILISLSVATSLDALMTGISLGFIHVNIVFALIIISTVTFLVTVVGGKIGEKSSFIPAKRAEIIGGMVLIAIGLKILIEHLNLIHQL
jgi:manganese efflux pump family protein